MSHLPTGCLFRTFNFSFGNRAEAGWLSGFSQKKLVFFKKLLLSDMDASGINNFFGRVFDVFTFVPVIELMTIRSITAPVKFILAFLLLGAAVTGCKPAKDEALIKSTSDAITAAVPALDTLRAYQAKLALLYKLVNDAPEKVQQYKPEAYEAIRTAVGEFSEKGGANLAPYEEDIVKCKAVLADYQAGKIDTEQAKKDLEFYLNDFTNFAPMADMLRTTYTENYTRFKALAGEALGGAKPIK